MSSTAKDAARHLINKLNATSSTSIRTSALTEIFSGLNLMVEAAKEEKMLAKQIPSMQREIQKLNSQLTTADDLKKREFEKEIAEIEQTLRDADDARKRLAQNRTMLHSLDQQLDSLRNKVRRALQ